LPDSLVNTVFRVAIFSALGRFLSRNAT
jgi:hypothetical protein